MKTSFKELLQSETPVLVDFWAPWCGPCKVMGPVLKDAAQEYQGRLKVIKIDVDKNPAISEKLQIQSIPTLILFHKGNIISRKSGALSLPQLKAWLEEYLVAA